MSDSNSNIGNISIIQISKYLECPICHFFSVSPINSCDNGHVICGICIDTVHRCPTCDNCNLKPNAALERILKREGIEIPCRNASQGCSKLITPEDMKKHLRVTCDLRPIHCIETKTKVCDKKCHSPKMIIEHWKDYHKIERLNVSTDSILQSVLGTVTVTYSLSQTWYKEATSPDHNPMYWHANYFEIDETFFIVHGHSKGENIHLWVTLLGEETKAKRYKYTASLASCRKVHGHGIDKKAQIVWNDVPMHCVQFHDLEKIKSLGHTVIIAYDTLKVFRLQDEEGYAWNLIIDICRATGEGGYHRLLVEDI